MPTISLKQHGTAVVATSPARRQRTGAWRLAEGAFWQAIIAAVRL
jgi:hypothetical protein